MRCGLVAFLLLAGCASTLRGYPGDRLPDDETAVIVSHAAKAMRIEVIDVDGTTRDWKWDRGDRLELTPGEHWITLDLTWRVTGVHGVRIPTTLNQAVDTLTFSTINAATSTRAATTVTVHVEAGKRYLLVARVPSEGEARCEITDAETGALVASSG